MDLEKRKYSLKLNDYLDSMIENYLKEKKLSSYQSYKISKKRLNTYLLNEGIKDLLVLQLNRSFIEQYEQYLRKNMKLSYNTICSELMRIKCIINKAIKEEIIELSDNPLKNYKIAYKKSTIVYLNEEEFLTLAELKIKNNSNTDLYRDLFVFSCDCGGLKSKDLINLKYMNYDGDYLNINTNGINRKLKIPHRSKSIISKYFNKNKNLTDFLFPVRERLSLDDSIESRIKLDGIVRKMNNSMKKTAVRAGIKKPITFITSRHTFATRALSKGIPVEVLQKLIGHVNIKDTYAYKNIIDLEIDKAMDKL